MTAYEALDAQQEAIAGDVAAWLRSALNPDHPGAPAADRIVNIYMLADIASAINRIADSVDLNAYQQGYHDGVRDEAPDLSAALEAEYQRGRAEERADAVRFLQHHGNQPGSVLLTAARALGYGDHVGAATSDQENYGDGPQ